MAPSPQPSGVAGRDAAPGRIDKRRYYAPEYVALENERLWPRVWLMAAWLGDLRRPGDYVVFDLGVESVLITRDQAGRVAAFHNVCMHRGTRLRDGRGHEAHLPCRYHGWQWALDGSLKHAPDADAFPGGIPAECKKLAPVACGEWAGFVWICLGEPEQSLAEYVRPLRDLVMPYHPEEFVLTRDFSTHWGCNWKTALDAFSETYHVNVTHPQLVEAVDPALATLEYFGVHGLLKVPMGLLGPDASEAARAESSIMRQLRGLGIDPLPYRDREHEARRALQDAIRAKGKQVGADFSGLDHEQLTDTRQFFIFPNLHFDFHGCNNFTLFRYRPHPRDPERSTFDFLDFSRPSFLGYSRDERAKHEELEPHQTPDTVRQDAEVLARVQRGMRSSGFSSPLLHAREARIAHVHRSLDHFLGQP